MITFITECMNRKKNEQIIGRICTIKPDLYPAIQYVIFNSYTSMNYTVKKSVDFTVKYLATRCQSISRCFYGRLLVEHFFRNQYMEGFFSPTTLENTVVGFKVYMTKSNTCLFATALCLIPTDIFAVYLSKAVAQSVMKKHQLHKETEK